MCEDELAARFNTGKNVIRYLAARRMVPGSMRQDRVFQFDAAIINEWMDAEPDVAPTAGRTFTDVQFKGLAILRESLRRASDSK